MSSIFRECKYVVKPKKVLSILLMIVNFFSDSDKENSHKEILMKNIQIMKNSDDEENSDKEILMKKI